MGLTLISEPTRTVNGILSNVDALKSQIPFEFLRLDFEAVALTQWFTEVQINITNDGIIENTQPGQVFYLDFGNDLNYETGFYNVNSAQDLGATTNLFFASITFVANTTVNVNDIDGRSQYNVAINLFSNVTNELLISSPIRYAPKQTGDLFVDLTGLFFGFQPAGGQFDFKLSYAESYNGQDQSAVLSNSYLGLAGKKQFLNDGGANMWEFLPNQRDEHEVTKISLVAGGNTLVDLGVLNTWFVNTEYVTVEAPPYKFTAQIDNTSGAVTTLDVANPFKGEIEAGAGFNVGLVRRPAGRFLTSFTEPVQVQFYKRQLSFVLDANLLTRTGLASVNLQVKSFDSAGAELSSAITNYSTIGLHTYDIDPYATVDNWELVLLGGPGGANVLSETMTFKQKQACPRSVLFEWQNQHGAIEQFVFDFNQAIIDTTSAGLITESPVVQTLDLVSNTLGRIPVDSQQTYKVMADSVDNDTFNALKYLKKSEIVNVYLDPIGEKKIRVAVVGDYSTASETNSNRTDFELTVMFPREFDINNIWQ